MGITVREAAPAEHDEIGRLMVEAYEQYQSVVKPAFWERYQADLRNVAVRAQHATILVAEEAGAIVGAVALYPKGDPQRPWPSEWSGVRVLAVPPAHRRKGVAHALMGECARRARAWGASAIGLNTVGYMSAALSLYETMGLERLPQYEVTGESGEHILAFGMELVPGGLNS